MIISTKSHIANGGSAGQRKTRQPANTLQTNLAGRKWGFILSNREQRRKQAKSGKSPAQYHKEQMELVKAEGRLWEMLKESYDKGQEAGFYRCMAITIYELRNLFDFGQKRAVRLIEKQIELADSIDKGLLTVEDIMKTIEEEMGIVISDSSCSFDKKG